MNNFDVIIIGSGLGGLLCGYILSNEGKNVCILEKNRQPGGLLQSFSLNGVGFDTGVHYIGALGEGQVLNRYFRYFGLMDNVAFRKLDENGFDIIGFNDGEYPLAMGFDNFREQLLSFYPAEKNALKKYVDALQNISRAFPLYNLEVPKDSMKEGYQNLSAYDFFHSFSDANLTGSIGRSPLPGVLAGNNFLYTGHPGKTPVHIAALINHSFISSAWRPVDGTTQIVTCLANKIQKAGGTLLTGRKVTRIGIRGKKFHIDTLQGEAFTSDNLVSAIHPAPTIAMTDPAIPRKAFSTRIMSLNNTPSCFALFIVLKENTFPGMNYNYYFHDDQNVWTGAPGKTWPGSYMLYTPAFSGNNDFARSMVIMTVMDFQEVRKWEATTTGLRDNGYQNFKIRKTDVLLDLVEKKFPGLRSKIKFMEASSPLTWRDRTGTPEGSMYGIRKDFHDPVKTTVLARTKIPDMYFTGQNTNLHGVLGVTIGSVLTCGEMIGLEGLIKKIRNA